MSFDPFEDPFAKHSAIMSFHHNWFQPGLAQRTEDFIQLMTQQNNQPAPKSKKQLQAKSVARAKKRQAEDQAKAKTLQIAKAKALQITQNKKGPIQKLTKNV